MKNIRETIITIFLTLSVIVSVAQPNAMTYRAYILNSQGLWEQSIKSSNTSYEKALAMYGFLNSTMADQDEKAFDKYYDDTIGQLEELAAQPEYSARAKAILSAVYGLAIAYDGWKGMFLGSKSSSLIGEAYSQSNKDPLVVKLYASNKFYTPKAFGGDLEVAIEQNALAIELFESNGDTVNNWMYLDALAHLGVMQRRNGEISLAIETYHRTLDIEPEFGWVKFSLLPEAQKLVVR